MVRTLSYVSALGFAVCALFIASSAALAATSTASVSITIDGEEAITDVIAMQDMVTVAWEIEGEVKNCVVRTKYRKTKATVETVTESGSMELPVFLDDASSLKKVTVRCKDVVLKERIKDIATYSFSDEKQPVMAKLDGETIDAFKSRKSLNAYRKCTDLGATECIWGELDLFSGENVALGDISFAFVSSNEQFFENDDETSDDDVGFFTLVVDVTAIDENAYIPRTPVRDAETGYSYDVVSQGGDSAVASEIVGVLGSTAAQEDGFFRIDEGETESFTLQVIFDPTVTGTYKVGVLGSGFNMAPDAPNQFSSAGANVETEFLVI